MAQTTSQQVNAVARTYAKALFDLADEKGLLAGVEADLQALSELWHDHADFVRLMSSRVITVEQRAGMIDRMFEGRIEGITFRFLHVLGRNNRGDQLAMIAEAFNNLMDQKHNRVDVMAYVASPLDDHALQTVRDQIATALGKDVRLSQQTDEALIGGIKLRMGDKLIDGSVAAQLRKMKAKIIEAGESNKRAILKD